MKQLLFEFPENSFESSLSTELQPFAWSWALFEQEADQNTEWHRCVDFPWQDYIPLISFRSFVAEQTAAYAIWWQAYVCTRPRGMELQP